MTENVLDRPVQNRPLASTAQALQTLILRGLPKPQTMPEAVNLDSNGDVEMDDGPITEQELQMEGGPITEEEQAQHDALLKEGADEVGARWRKLQAKVNSKEALDKDIPEDIKTLRAAALKQFLPLFEDPSQIEVTQKVILSINRSILALNKKNKTRSAESLYYIFPIDLIEFYTRAVLTVYGKLQQTDNPKGLAQYGKDIVALAMLKLQQYHYRVDDVIPKETWAAFEKLVATGLKSAADPIPDEETRSMVVEFRKFQQQTEAATKESSPEVQKSGSSTAAGIQQKTDAVTKKSSPGVSKSGSSTKPSIATDMGYLISMQKIGNGHRIIFNQGTPKLEVFVSVPGSVSCVNPKEIEVEQLTTRFAKPGESREVSKDDLIGVVQVPQAKGASHEPITYILLKDATTSAGVWFSISRVATMMGASLANLRQGVLKKLLEQRKKRAAIIEKRFVSGKLTTEEKKTMVWLSHLYEDDDEDDEDDDDNGQEPDGQEPGDDGGQEPGNDEPEEEL